MEITGIGSWPGTDIDEAVRQTFDLWDLPYLPELPARGPGSDMVGRALGVLPGLAFERSPLGWQVADLVGNDQRRARARLIDDLDVLAERADGYAGGLKISLCGPWTMIATVEMARGGLLLADPGARRDIVQSWQVAALDVVAELVRRVPGAEPVLQVDEPSLPAVLDGRVRTTSGLSAYPAVDQEEIGRAWRHVQQASDGVTRLVVHSCAPRLPVGLLGPSTAVAVDTGVLSRSDWDAMAAHVDAGGELWLGILPTHPGSPVPSVDEVVRTALTQLRPLELPELAARLTLTPACGLAGFTPQAAVRAAEVLRRAAPRLCEELAR